MRTFLRAAFAAAVFAALSLNGPAKAQEFTPGQCVLASGVYAKVLGPSSVPGLVLVQSLRGGSINGYLPTKLTAAACPVPHVAQAACFTNDVGQGATPFETTVRQNIGASLMVGFFHPTVRLDQVELGGVHQWSTEEQSDFPGGDLSQGIVTTQAAYEVCEDSADRITISKGVRDFACFTSLATGRMMCEMEGTHGDQDRQSSQQVFEK